MKKIIALFLAVAILCLSAGCSPKGNALVIKDATGQTIATIYKYDFNDDELVNPSYRSYIHLALSEAVEALAAIKQCDTAKAQELLFSGEYILNTAFTISAHEAIDKMFNSQQGQKLSLGSSIIDAEGRVLATYSGGDEQYSLMGHSPFSTIKPLSVYAPGIEHRTFNWSTKIVDKPYKQMKNNSGKLENWPTNPNYTYSYERTSLVECIINSLNTTAVHGIKSVGVENSIKFMQESLGMNLDYEKNKLTLEGEEEVLGNLAMGYLYSGVNSIDLAGYYGIFANGGEYIKPYALISITDTQGNQVFTQKAEKKQALSAETAYIMNRLLTMVVSPIGTGSKAQVKGVELLGKTGTGSHEGGNWFVGVTPQYRCAIWHETGKDNRNHAAELFTEIMKNMPEHTEKKFKPFGNVKKEIICSDSGLLYTTSCKNMEIGYYVSDRKPATCDAH